MAAPLSSVPSNRIPVLSRARFDRRKSINAYPVFPLAPPEDYKLFDIFCISRWSERLAHMKWRNMGNLQKIFSPSENQGGYNLDGPNQPSTFRNESERAVRSNDGAHHHRTETVSQSSTAGFALHSNEAVPLAAQQRFAFSDELEKTKEKHQSAPLIMTISEDAFAWSRIRTVGSGNLDTDRVRESFDRVGRVGREIRVSDITWKSYTGGSKLGILIWQNATPLFRHILYKNDVIGMKSLGDRAVIAIVTKTVFANNVEVSPPIRPRSSTTNHSSFIPLAGSGVCGLHFLVFRIELIGLDLVRIYRGPHMQFTDRDQTDLSAYRRRLRLSVVVRYLSRNSNASNALRGVHRDVNLGRNVIAGTEAHGRGRTLSTSSAPAGEGSDVEVDSETLWSRVRLSFGSFRSGIQSIVTDTDETASDPGSQSSAPLEPELPEDEHDYLDLPVNVLSTPWYETI